MCEVAGGHGVEDGWASGAEGEGWVLLRQMGRDVRTGRSDLVRP